MHFPSPASTALAQPIKLYDITTGKLIAQAAGFTGASRWTWICDVIADHCDCQPEDVDCIETEDGDRITANGVHVAHTGQW